MKGKSSLLLSIILLLISSVALINIGTAPSVAVSVSPSINTASPGQQFTITIDVANVERLYAWQLLLEWDPTLLEATSVTEGAFLSQEGAWLTAFVPKISNELGEIRAAGWLLGEEAKGATGSGTLVVITFLAKAEGGSSLDLIEWDEELEDGTMLLNYFGDEMLLSLEDGYFAYPLPKVYVDPSEVIDPNLASGSTFNVSIDVSEVVGLYAWQFLLKWDPTLLNATSVTEGPFLSQEEILETDFYKEIDQSAGSAYVNCTLVGKPVPTASGNGTLATITFQVKAYGSVILELDEIRLVDIDGAMIPHAFGNSFFSNAMHDIAVILVEASPTEVRIGDSVSISVTIKNEGNMAETDIDVSISTPSPPSPSYQPIGTQTIDTLDSGQETTLTFSWDTSDVAEGEYTVRAEASTVLDETDTADNVRDMNGVVKVGALGLMLPLPMMIIAVIIIAAVIGFSLFFYTRRRPSVA